MENAENQEKNIYYMNEALKEAKKAYKANEVPVGAVLVYEDRIIARAHNQVELLQDATAHAEMIALTMGASALSNWRLTKTTLYCTIEPCAMCAGAMFLSRIQKLIWGAPDLRHGACGSWVNLFDKKHPTHSIEVIQGISSDPCSAILQDFFKMRRKNER
jgi:tRNA(adenine34) deaminase